MSFAELGTIYSRTELKKLLDIHSSVVHSDLTPAETKVLSGLKLLFMCACVAVVQLKCVYFPGALDFGTKEVSQIMTPIDHVCSLTLPFPSVLLIVFDSPSVPFCAGLHA